MVEVDVFWAYGLGGTLAAAAGRPLEETDKPFDAPQFSRVLAFLALVWAPTGMLLLLRHPSWETMQAADSFFAMPVWLILGFGLTNVTQGILGYWVTHRLMRAGRHYLGHLNWMLGYLGMFFILLYGWDGLGYDRFLYDRDMFGGVAWAPGAGLQDGAGIEFFASSVAMTLYLDGLYLLPALFAMVVVWTRRSALASGVVPPARTALVLRHLGAIFLVGLGSAAVAALVVHGVGQALGAGDHAARAAGAGGSTAAHVFSYALGLPLSAALLWAVLYRRGGLVERYLMPLSPHVVGATAAPAVPLGHPATAGDLR